MKRNKILLVLSLIFVVTHSSPLPDFDNTSSSKCTPSPSCSVDSILSDVWKVGTSYTFAYKSKAITSVQGSNYDVSGLGMTAKVHIDVLQKCAMELRVTDVILTEASQRDLFTPSETLTKAYEQLHNSPLRFTITKQGQIDKICPHTTEPVWITNIKRGIVSTFIQTFPDRPDTMLILINDVHGEACPLDLAEDYERVTTSRDLTSCSLPNGFRTSIPSSPYNLPLSTQSTPLFQSTRNCTSMTADASITCSERHYYLPMSNVTPDAEVTGIETMVEQSIVPISNSLISRDASQSQNDLYETTIYFEHTFEEQQKATVDPALATLSQLCPQTEVRPETPELFTKLVYQLRQLSQTDIDLVWTTTQEKWKTCGTFFTDAVSFASTDESIAFMVKLSLDSQISSANQDLWLTGLAFQQQPPSVNILKSVAKLIEPTSSLANRKSALLGVSGLIHLFCQSQSDCEEVEIVQEMGKNLLNRLGNDCQSDLPDEEAMIRTVLQALGNAGLKMAATKLGACASRTENSINIRVSALKAFRRTPCDADRSVATELLSNKDLDTELRINAYLAIMNCPSPTTIFTIKDILAKEEVNQVGSFIWTHLTNLRETSDPHKQRLRQILQDSVLRAQFDLEKLKFSRNYEKSALFPGWNVGGQVESNVIFSQNSFIPRSASLNLTVDLFGRAYNIFNMEGRVEGMDKVLERFLGPKGIIQKKRAGKNPMFDFNVIKQLLRTSVGLQLFGQEIGFDKPEFAQYSPVKLLSSLQQGLDFGFGKNLLLLDSTISYPTGMGLPLKVFLNGTVALKVSASASLKAPSTLQLNLKPSATIHTSLLVGMDTQISTYGVRVVTSSHTSTQTAAKISARLGTGGFFNIELDSPKDKQEVITLASDIYVINSKGEHNQKLSEVADESICAENAFLGVAFCSELSFPRLNHLRHPLAGPTTRKLYIKKLDNRTGYILSGQAEINKDNRLIFNLGYNSPSSPEVSKYGISFFFEPYRGVFAELVYPSKSYRFETTLNRNAAILALTIDSEDILRAELSGKDHVQIGDDIVSEIKLVCKIPGLSPISAVTQMKIVDASLFLNVQVDNVFHEPATAKLELRDVEENGARTLIEAEYQCGYGSGIVTGSASRVKGGNKVDWIARHKFHESVSSDKRLYVISWNHNIRDVSTDNLNKVLVSFGLGYGRNQEHYYSVDLDTESTGFKHTRITYKLNSGSTGEGDSYKSNAQMDGNVFSTISDTDGSLNANAGYVFNYNAKRIKQTGDLAFSMSPEHLMTSAKLVSNGIQLARISVDIVDKTAQEYNLHVLMGVEAETKTNKWELDTEMYRTSVDDVKFITQYKINQLQKYKMESILTFNTPLKMGFTSIVWYAPLSSEYEPLKFGASYSLLNLQAIESEVYIDCPIHKIDMIARFKHIVDTNDWESNSRYRLDTEMLIKSEPKVAIHFKATAIRDLGQWHYEAKAQLSQMLKYAVVAQLTFPLPEDSRKEFIVNLGFDYPGRSLNFKFNSVLEYLKMNTELLLRWADKEEIVVRSMYDIDDGWTQKGLEASVTVITPFENHELMHLGISALGKLRYRKVVVEYKWGNKKRIRLDLVVEPKSLNDFTATGSLITPYHQFSYIGVHAKYLLTDISLTTNARIEVGPKTHYEITVEGTDNSYVGRIDVNGAFKLQVGDAPAINIKADLLDTGRSATSNLKVYWTDGDNTDLIDLSEASFDMNYLIKEYQTRNKATLVIKTPFDPLKSAKITWDHFHNDMKASTQINMDLNEKKVFMGILKGTLARTIFKLDGSVEIADWGKSVLTVRHQGKEENMRSSFKLDLSNQKIYEGRYSQTFQNHKWERQIRFTTPHEELPYIDVSVGGTSQSDSSYTLEHSVTIGQHKKEVYKVKLDIADNKGDVNIRTWFEPLRSVEYHWLNSDSEIRHAFGSSYGLEFDYNQNFYDARFGILVRTPWEELNLASISVIPEQTKYEAKLKSSFTQLDFEHDTGNTKFEFESPIFTTKYKYEQNDNLLPSITFQLTTPNEMLRDISLTLKSNLDLKLNANLDVLNTQVSAVVSPFSIQFGLKRKQLEIKLNFTEKIDQDSNFMILTDFNIISDEWVKISCKLTSENEFEFNSETSFETLQKIHLLSVFNSNQNDAFSHSHSLTIKRYDQSLLVENVITRQSHEYIYIKSHLSIPSGSLYSLSFTMKNNAESFENNIVLNIYDQEFNSAITILGQHYQDIQIKMLLPFDRLKEINFIGRTNLNKDELKHTSKLLVTSIDFIDNLLNISNSLDYIYGNSMVWKTNINDRGDHSMVIKKENNQINMFIDFFNLEYRILTMTYDIDKKLVLEIPLDPLFYYKLSFEIQPNKGFVLESVLNKISFMMVKHIEQEETVFESTFNWRKTRLNAKIYLDEATQALNKIILNDTFYDVVKKPNNLLFTSTVLVDITNQNAMVNILGVDETATIKSTADWKKMKFTFVADTMNWFGFEGKLNILPYESEVFRLIYNLREFQEPLKMIVNNDQKTISASASSEFDFLKEMNIVIENWNHMTIEHNQLESPIVISYLNDFDDVNLKIEMNPFFTVIKRIETVHETEYNLDMNLPGIEFPIKVNSIIKAEEIEFDISAVFMVAIKIKQEGPTAIKYSGILELSGEYTIKGDFDWTSPSFALYVTTPYEEARSVDFVVESASQSTLKVNEKDIFVYSCTSDPYAVRITTDIPEFLYINVTSQFREDRIIVRLGRQGEIVNLKAERLTDSIDFDLQTMWDEVKYVKLTILTMPKSCQILFKHNLLSGPIKLLLLLDSAEKEFITFDLTLPFEALSLLKLTTTPAPDFATRTFEVTTYDYTIQMNNTIREGYSFEIQNKANFHVLLSLNDVLTFIIEFPSDQGIIISKLYSTHKLEFYWHLETPFEDFKLLEAQLALRFNQGSLVQFDGSFKLNCLYGIVTKKIQLNLGEYPLRLVIDSNTPFLGYEKFTLIAEGLDTPTGKVYSVEMNTPYFDEPLTAIYKQIKSENALTNGEFTLKVSCNDLVKSTLNLYFDQIKGITGFFDMKSVPFEMTSIVTEERFYLEMNGLSNQLVLENDNIGSKLSLTLIPRLASLETINANISVTQTLAINCESKFNHPNFGSKSLTFILDSNTLETSLSLKSIPDNSIVGEIKFLAMAETLNLEFLVNDVQVNSVRHNLKGSIVYDYKTDVKVKVLYKQNDQPFVSLSSSGRFDPSVIASLNANLLIEPLSFDHSSQVKIKFNDYGELKEVDISCFDNTKGAAIFEGKMESTSTSTLPVKSKLLVDSEYFGKLTTTLNVDYNALAWKIDTPNPSLSSNGKLSYSQSGNTFELNIKVENSYIGGIYGLSCMTHSGFNNASYQLAIDTPSQPIKLSFSEELLTQELIVIQYKFNFESQALSLECTSLINSINYIQSNLKYKQNKALIFSLDDLWRLDDTQGFYNANITMFNYQLEMEATLDTYNGIANTKLDVFDSINAVTILKGKLQSKFKTSSPNDLVKLLIETEYFGRHYQVEVSSTYHLNNITWKINIPISQLSSTGELTYVTSFNKLESKLRVFSNYFGGEHGISLIIHNQDTLVSLEFDMKTPWQPAKFFAKWQLVSNENQEMTLKFTWAHSKSVSIHATISNNPNSGKLSISFASPLKLVEQIQLDIDYLKEYDNFHTTIVGELIGVYPLKSSILMKQQQWDTIVLSVGVTSQKRNLLNVVFLHNSSAVPMEQELEVAFMSAEPCFHYKLRGTFQSLFTGTIDITTQIPGFRTIKIIGTPSEIIPVAYSLSVEDQKLQLQLQKNPLDESLDYSATFDGPYSGSMKAKYNKQGKSFGIKVIPPNKKPIEANADYEVKDNSATLSVSGENSAISEQKFKLEMKQVYTSDNSIESEAILQTSFKPIEHVVMTFGIKSQPDHRIFDHKLIYSPGNQLRFHGKIPISLSNDMEAEIGLETPYDIIRSMKANLKHKVDNEGRHHFKHAISYLDDTVLLYGNALIKDYNVEGLATLDSSRFGSKYMEAMIRHEMTPNRITCQHSIKLGPHSANLQGTVNENQDGKDALITLVSPFGEQKVILKKSGETLQDFENVVYLQYQPEQYLSLKAAHNPTGGYISGAMKCNHGYRSIRTSFAYDKQAKFELVVPGFEKLIQISNSLTADGISESVLSIDNGKTAKVTIRCNAKVHQAELLLPGLSLNQVSAALDTSLPSLKTSWNWKNKKEFLNVINTPTTENKIGINASLESSLQEIPSVSITILTNRNYEDILLEIKVNDVNRFGFVVDKANIVLEAMTSHPMVINGVRLAINLQDPDLNLMWRQNGRSHTFVLKETSTDTGSVLTLRTTFPSPQRASLHITPWGPKGSLAASWNLVKISGDWEMTSSRVSCQLKGTAGVIFEVGMDVDIAKNNVHLTYADDPKLNSKNIYAKFNWTYVAEKKAFNFETNFFPEITQLNINYEPMRLVELDLKSPCDFARKLIVKMSRVDGEEYDLTYSSKLEYNRLAMSVECQQRYSATGQEIKGKVESNYPDLSVDVKFEENLNKREIALAVSLWDNRVQVLSIFSASDNRIELNFTKENIKMELKFKKENDYKLIANGKAWFGSDIFSLQTILMPTLLELELATPFKNLESMKFKLNHQHFALFKFDHISSLSVNEQVLYDISLNLNYYSASPSVLLIIRDPIDLSLNIVLGETVDVKLAMTHRSDTYGTNAAWIWTDRSKSVNLTIVTPFRKSNFISVMKLSGATNGHILISLSPSESTDSKWMLSISKEFQSFIMTLVSPKRSIRIDGESSVENSEETYRIKINPNYKINESNPKLVLATINYAAFTHDGSRALLTISIPYLKDPIIASINWQDTQVKLNIKFTANNEDNLLINVVQSKKSTNTEYSEDIMIKAEQASTNFYILYKINTVSNVYGGGLRLTHIEYKDLKNQLRNFSLQYRWQPGELYEVTMSIPQKSITLRAKADWNDMNSVKYQLESICDGSRKVALLLHLASLDAALPGVTLKINNDPTRPEAFAQISARYVTERHMQMEIFRQRNGPKSRINDLLISLQLDNEHLLRGQFYVTKKAIALVGMSNNFVNVDAVYQVLNCFDGVTTNFFRYTKSKYQAFVEKLPEFEEAFIYIEKEIYECLSEMMYIPGYYKIISRNLFYLKSLSKKIGNLSRDISETLSYLVQMSHTQYYRAYVSEYIDFYFTPIWYQTSKVFTNILLNAREVVDTVVKYLPPFIENVKDSSNLFIEWTRKNILQPLYSKIWFKANDIINQIEASIIQIKNSDLTKFHFGTQLNEMAERALISLNKSSITNKFRNMSPNMTNSYLNEFLNFDLVKIMINFISENIQWTLKNLWSAEFIKMNVQQSFFQTRDSVEERIIDYLSSYLRLDQFNIWIDNEGIYNAQVYLPLVMHDLKSTPQMPTLEDSPILGHLASLFPSAQTIFMARKYGWEMPSLWPTTTSTQPWYEPDLYSYATLADSQVLTFDQKLYTMMDRQCSLTLSAHEKNWSVKIINTPEEHLQIITEGHMINIYKDYRVTINDVVKELPVMVTYAFSIMRTGSSVKFDDELFEFSVVADMENNMYTVGSSVWYHNQLSGVFGNRDNEPFNDLQNENGEHVSSEVFVQQWTNAGDCMSSPALKTIDEFGSDDEEERQRRPACNFLFKCPLSPLARCFHKVDPAPFLRMCQCSKSKCPVVSVCKAARMYAAHCEKRHVRVRVPRICHKCPHQQVPNSNSADVIILTQPSCPSMGVGPFMKYLQNTFDRAGVKYVRYGAVTYGQYTWGPSSLTVNGGQLLSANYEHIATEIMNQGSHSIGALPSLTDPSDAIAYITEAYPWLRDGRSSRHIVAFHCLDGPSTTDNLFEAQNVLNELNISLHVVVPHRFEMEQNVKDKEVLGISSQRLYTERNRVGLPIYRRIVRPNTPISNLALHSQGSVFNYQALFDPSGVDLKMLRLKIYASQIVGNRKPGSILQPCY